jgi:hypothetical protein
MKFPHVKFSSPITFFQAIWRAAASWLGGQGALADDVLRRQRANECAFCEEYDPETAQCMVCTCFVSLKVALKSEKCPRGYW